MNSFRNKMRQAVPALAFAFLEGIFGVFGFLWTIACLFGCFLMFAFSMVLVNDHVLPHVPFLPESWYPTTAFIAAVPMTIIGFTLAEIVGLLALLLVIVIVAGIISLIASGCRRLTGKTGGSSGPPPGGESH